jgi:LytR cell envelope-related transcriptional attenuator
MTMLSPLGRVPQQRPPRPRRQRRVLPAVAVLCVLVLAVAVVWWRVLHKSTDDTAAQGSCVTPTSKALALNPKSVKVRVYNATTTAGLAKTVGDQLHRRGFAISTTSNDPLANTRKVDGIGELRYGPKGTDQAVLVSLQFPGIKLAEDARTDAIVDVAVGPSFKTLPSAAAYNTAKKALNDKVKSQQPTCGK